MKWPKLNRQKEVNNSNAVNNNNNNNMATVQEDPKTGSGADCDPLALPDACGNDIREERLLDRQVKDDDQSWVEYLLKRERNLLIAAAILVVLMNIETGRYVLYPFKIFSTWVHEMCHGMAAILSGGYIAKLRIYENGSGLANTGGTSASGFVASGGYPGTAVTGCLLLLFRRTTLGPTIGTIGLGVLLIASVLLWVGNTWGRVTLSLEGVALILCGWKLPAVLLDNLYNFLALTVSLNAFENIQDLYEYGSGGYAGGKYVQTDATTVASKWGGDYRVWATIWLIMSIGLTVVGILFARNARAFLTKGTWTSSSEHATSSSANGGDKIPTYTADGKLVTPTTGYRAHVV